MLVSLFAGLLMSTAIPVAQECRTYSLYFNSGVSDLVGPPLYVGEDMDRSAQNRLNEIAKYVEDQALVRSGLRIAIVGHTDRDEFERGFTRLDNERAQVVASAIRRVAGRDAIVNSQGVDATAPARSGAASNPLNRRVSIEIC